MCARGASNFKVSLIEKVAQNLLQLMYIGKFHNGEGQIEPLSLNPKLGSLSPKT